MKPPTTIYLQWLDDDGEVAEEVTWCADMILETDTKYIRADLVDALRARNAELEAAARRDDTDNGYIVGGYVSDGLGNFWPAKCPNCGAPMQVRKPGLALCADECYLVAEREAIKDTTWSVKI